MFRSLRWATACVALLVCAAEAAPPLYRVTLLPAPPDNGRNSTIVVSSINNAGVVGGGVGAHQNQAPTLWSGTPYERVSLPNLQRRRGWGEVNGLNDTGIAVGTSSNGTYQLPVAWSTTSHATPLPGLGGEIAPGWAAAVNDSGVITGLVSSSAVIWPNIGALPVALGVLPGGQGASTYTVPRAINGNGAVAGVGPYDSIGHVHAFVWTAGGGMQDLGVLAGAPGISVSKAHDMNGLGQVVGRSTNAAGQDGAFIWSTASGMREIAVPPGSTRAEAVAINDAGVVVGFYDDAAGRHSFVWSEADGLVDLMARIDPADPLASGLTAVTAIDINAGGQIAGMVLRSGELKPVPAVLTPVP